MNPQRNPPRPQQQLSAEQVQKQREFLTQQQRLRRMASTNTQKAVSADALIQNLLAKKETFKLSNPLPSTTLASTSAETAVETLKFKQTQYDSGRAPKVPCQQVVADWLSPKSPSFPELYRKVFSLVGEPDGMVDTGKIFPVLLTSGLSTDVLGYIWGLVNRCVAGKLTENELYAVLALVALAQKGYSFNSASVLSLVSQSPIPSLNLGTEPQATSKTRREDLNLQSSLQDHQGLPTSPLSMDFPVDLSASSSKPSTFDSKASTAMPAFVAAADDFDDFTDFQSALTSAPVAVPTPDPLSFPEPVFVQKFPVTIGARGIGSRLANHSLGSSRPANHGPPASKPAYHGPAPSKPRSSLLDDDFSDFQRHTHGLAETDVAPPASQAAESELDASQPMASQLWTSQLQSSCIESSQPMACQPIASRLESSSAEEFDFGPPNLASSNAVTSTPRSLDPSACCEESSNPPGSIHPAGSELMSVEEDRYSALRALSLFALDASEQVAAETPSTDDSFAAIATRAAPAQSGHEQGGPTDGESTMLDASPRSPSQVPLSHPTERENACPDSSDG